MIDLIQQRMKTFPVITTGAIGEMVLYHDTIIINKVSEETIDRTVEKLKEAYPSVKYFIYVDGIFFRMYYPETSAEAKKIINHYNNTKQELK